MFVLDAHSIVKELDALGLGKPVEKTDKVSLQHHTVGPCLKWLKFYAFSFQCLNDLF